MSEAVYLGNPNLKRANVAQQWTKEEIEEYAKCMKDPIYFIKTYRVMGGVNNRPLFKPLLH